MSEQLFYKNSENSAPHRGTARARPRSPPAKSGEASKVRHNEEAARREVDAMASKLENGSNPGLSNTSGVLRPHLIIVYRFIGFEVLRSTFSSSPPFEAISRRVELISQRAVHFAPAPSLIIPKPPQTVLKRGYSPWSTISVTL